MLSGFSEDWKKNYACVVGFGGYIHTDVQSSKLKCFFLFSLSPSICFKYDKEVKICEH